MRKLVQILATAFIGIAMSTAVVGAAPAVSSCNDIGPGATCTIDSTNNNNIDITCNNNVDVVTVNGQTSNSGNATLSGNGSGGYTYSGSASNSNQTITDLGVVGCGPAVAAAAPTATPAATSTPAASTPAAAAPAKAAPATAVLPNTGSDTALDTSLAGVAVLGGAMVASRFGVMAYRRHLLK